MTPANPVASGEPVSDSTYNGTAMVVIALPARETPSAASRPMSGARRRNGGATTVMAGGTTSR
jgi:hypothetical protein